MADGQWFNVANSIRNVLRSEEKFHHLYFEATEWKEASTLEVKVTGNSEPNRTGYERRLIHNGAKN